MFDAKLLWKERFVSYIKETNRYLRYILNGHLLIVLIFLIGTAAFYYSQWVQTLAPDFPVAFIMAIVLGVLLTHSPIHTLLKEADTIFLLPLEKKMTPYFQRSFFVSLGLQGYGLLFGLAAFMPMYAKVSREGFRPFFLFFILLLVVKLWNILLRWYVLFHQEESVRIIDSIIRLICNITFLYFIFSTSRLIVVSLVSAIMLALIIYFKKASKGKSIKWDLLIELEGKRMMRFYRLANLFTDVPKLQEEIKKRYWLNSLYQFIPFNQKSTYTYLYARTFIRTGDYLGLLFRLTIIGALMIWLGKLGLGSILITCLFLYLTGLQLLPLWNHHSMTLWLNLYPVPLEKRKQSLLKLFSIALVFENSIFAIVLLIKEEWLLAGISFLSGCIFIYLFLFIYVNKKIQ